MKTFIKVQYLGTLRLLLNKKEDVFVFDKQPTVADLLAMIGGRYGRNIANECRKQILYVYLPNTDKVKQLSFFNNQKELFEDGSLVKIVNLITGG